MKKLFKSVAYIILLSISSATFAACARAANDHVDGRRLRKWGSRFQSTRGLEPI